MGISTLTGKSGYSLGGGGSGPPPCDCDALLAQIAALEAEVLELETDINALKGWVNYGFQVPTATANASVDTGAGIITINHPGNPGTDPSTAITYVSWPLVNADGTAALGIASGPYQLLELSGTSSGATVDVVIVVTDTLSLATSTAGSEMGFRRQTTGQKGAYAGNKPVGDIWYSSFAGNRPGDGSWCTLAMAPVAGSNGITSRSVTITSDGLPIGQANGLVINTQTMPLNTLPNYSFIHVVVFGAGILTGTYKLSVAPSPSLPYATP